MSATWGTILGLALATAVVKGSGPALLGGRKLPQAAGDVIALLAPALLAALVVTQTLGGGDRELVLDPRAPAVAIAGVAIAFRASPLVVIAVAASAAALIRALF